MKSSELTPLLFTVYLAAASGRSPALPCFAAFLALVRFSRLFAFTQLFFQTLQVLPLLVVIHWVNDLFPSELNAYHLATLTLLHYKYTLLVVILFI